MKNDNHNVCTIRKSGVLMPIPMKVMEDFMHIVLKTNKRMEVQQDILKEYVERYGAV